MAIGPSLGEASDEQGPPRHRHPQRDLRGKNAAVLARANDYRAEHGLVTISIITLVEIVRGWHQAGKPERAEVFRAWLPNCKVLPLDDAPGWLAGEIAGALARTGQPIGLADVAIAATTIHHGLVLVTGNADHHDRVRTAGFPLTWENWRVPTGADP